jgi:outer membrane receptor protein involved in Fe transport
MKPQNHMARRHNRNLLCCALASCLAVAAPAAFAQSTAATIRGQVVVDSVPAGNAQVTATNLATGLKRTVQTTSSGSYALAGLPPGSYRIDVAAGGQTSTRNVTVLVGQTATLNLGVGGAPAPVAAETTTLGTVTVIAPAFVETKTSEVATYVSRKQIEALPQGSRNFLAFADTVPGVQFSTANDGSTSLRSGAQLSNGINVFIDGVGQKDYVLKGGITGQDSSRGNPFPQLGIAEYKVITSNYKAEFDQLSSAAITAVTRSGTNEFHGDLFGDYTSDQWRAPTVAEQKSGNKTRSREEQYGFSLGGPILQDRMHFFVAYEGKEYDSPRTIRPGRNIPIEQLPAFLQPLARESISAPFSEDLYFGKIDWTPGDDHLVELTLKRRSEDEVTGLNGIETSQYATLKTGKETRADLRYQYSAMNWLNDAHITFEDSTFGPRPATFDNGYNLLVPRIGQEARDNPDMEDVLRAGGGGDFQDKGQRGYAFQDDFTFNGWERHTLKTGIKYKLIDISAFQQQPFSPQFRYDLTRSDSVPYEVLFTASGNGIPGTVESSNKQLGLYVQDDWEVNEHLLLNLGLRWDYEQTPSYEDHVTPASLVSALEGYSNIHNANVDYNIDNYISNGHNRNAVKDAFQPRLGFSYDLNADQRHVIFGGAGRSYNRNQFDYLSYELYSLAFQRYTYQFNTPGHPCNSTSCYDFDPSFLDRDTLYALAAANPNNGSEVFLLNNDIKTPYSDQFSLGMRNTFNAFGHDWNTSATVVRVLSHDGILFSIGNRRPDGTFFPPGTSFGNAPGADLPGYSRFFLGNNAVETRLTSVLLSLEKPYTRNSAWGMTVAYTYSDAKENRNNSDVFTFDYPNLDKVGFTPALGVSKHRLVAAGITDFWGMTFSGKLTLASPPAREALNCHDTTNFSNCFFDPLFVDQRIGFKQFDMALQKEWQVGDDLKFRIRGDVLNVFNWRNYTDYETWRGGPSPDFNPNFGNRNGDGIILPTRTFKLSLGYAW